jgi:hypothetical protein
MRTLVTKDADYVIGLVKTGAMFATLVCDRLQPLICQALEQAACSVGWWLYCWRVAAGG